MNKGEMLAKINEYCESTDCFKCVFSNTSCIYDMLDYSELKKLYGDVVDNTPPTNTTSNVDHPSHYNQGSIECIDAMLSAFGKDEVKSFCKLNAFKYIWRSKFKRDLEDIKKANWYISKFVELSKPDGTSETN